MRRVIRLLYYLPMERMNNKDYRAWYEDELNEKIKQLEEENKKLNEKYDWLWKIYTEDVKEREEENKKLREERDKYYAEWHARHS